MEPEQQAGLDFAIHAAVLRVKLPHVPKWLDAIRRYFGSETVAVFSDADAHSAHVAACDEAVHVAVLDRKSVV